MNLTDEIDINTLRTTDTHFQYGDLPASVASTLHYPVPESGILEVVNESSTTVHTYTTWYGRRFWRTVRTPYAWQPWAETARVTHAYSKKKIAWIGDSIVEGNDYANKVGWNLGATVCKFGFANCTMAKHPQTSGYDKMAMYRLANAIATGNFSGVMSGATWLRDNSSDNNVPQVTAMAALDWDTVDYLVLAFGTNDCYGTTPLGTALTPDATGSSYMGAISYVIETIQASHPHIQIMLTGLAWRTRQFNTTPELNSDTVADAQGNYLIEYQDALLAAGAQYHIPAQDFYRTSGINRNTYSQYLGDGVHPNSTKGVQLWVKKMTAFMLAN